MRRRVRPSIVAALLILVALLGFTLSRHDEPFSVGPLLPSAKVKPQLVSAWDIGVLLAPDGSLWAWGGTEHRFAGLFGITSRSAIPQQIGIDRDWRKIAATASHMLAIKADGSLWAWGNWPGLPPQEAIPSSAVARRIGSEMDWQEINIGATHCMALKRDGSLWTWGRNLYGQLGLPTSNSAANPVRVGDERWHAIAAGAFNSYALKHDGTLWGWGLDPLGAKGSNNDFSPRLIDASTNWVAISASSYCLIALKADGSLWFRGQNARWMARDFLTNATS